MKKIGIFGGSFSPPHNGHLLAARQFMDAMSLDELLVMPTYVSPHKQNKNTLSSAHRLAMTRLAFASLPGATVSDYEAEKGGVSYTADTLTHFAKEGELYFLCGTDMFLSLSSWYRPDIIFKNANIVVVSREKGHEKEIREAAERYRSTYENVRVTVLENKVLPLSSTEVRNAIAEGKDVSQLIPPSVEVYIREHKLYL